MKGEKIVTKFGLLYFGSMVLVFVCVFAYASFQPETSLLGEAINNKTGRFVLVFVAAIPFILIEKILNKHGFKIVQNKNQ